MYAKAFHTHSRAAYYRARARTDTHTPKHLRIVPVTDGLGRGDVNISSMGGVRHLYTKVGVDIRFRILRSGVCAVCVCTCVRVSLNERRLI